MNTPSSSVQIGALAPLSRPGWVEATDSGHRRVLAVLAYLDAAARMSGS